MPQQRPIKSPRKLIVPIYKYRLKKTGLGQEWKTSHEMPGASLCESLSLRKNQPYPLQPVYKQNRLKAS